MSAKKLPETDEDRIDILKTAIEQEEKNESWDKILSIMELQELRLFISTYENSYSILNQAIKDRDKTIKSHEELFKNVQLYISHFIQVLFLTVIRNEIKPEHLALYGLDEKRHVIPNLSTQEAVMKWGENLMRGETERTSRGGIPLYNPAIAKVKVHYELFKESIHSLSIYEKNLSRSLNNIVDLRNTAENFIANIWARVEERYSRTSFEEQALRFKAYKIQFYYRKGDQLNIFD